MSGDICKARTLTGSGFVVLWLVIASGVECEMAEEFAGLVVDDTDVEVVDDYDDGTVRPLPARSELALISAHLRDCFSEGVHLVRRLMHLVSPDPPVGCGLPPAAAAGSNSYLPVGRDGVTQPRYRSAGRWHR
jgi:hypothetical protein